MSVLNNLPRADLCTAAAVDGPQVAPVTLAAVGAHTLRLAGEVGDGVRRHGLCTRRYLAELIIPYVQDGMTRGKRTRKHFEIAGGGVIATGPDDAATARAFELIRTTS